MNNLPDKDLLIMDKKEFIKNNLKEEIISHVTVGRSDAGLTPYSEEEYNQILSDLQQLIEEMTNSILQFISEENENVYSFPNDLYRETLDEYHFYDMYPIDE
jgi:hypothetical protein